MPIPPEELKPQVFGSVSNQILNVLKDNQGYYVDELLAKIQCHPKTLYTALGMLKRRGFILSKTMPDKSEELGKPKNTQIYFKSQNK